MTNELITLHTIDANDEPRVLDTDLAERLGMVRPNMIRTNIIDPNRSELEGLGVLLAVQAKSSDPLGRGRPSTAYYLNEEQALLVCTLARTDTAKLVRATLIKVFVAWRRGELIEPRTQQPAIPQDYASALRLAADEHEKRLALPGHSDAKI